MKCVESCKGSCVNVSQFLRAVGTSYYVEDVWWKGLYNRQSGAMVQWCSYDMAMFIQLQWEEHVPLRAGADVAKDLSVSEATAHSVWAPDLILSLSAVLHCLQCLHAVRRLPHRCSVFVPVFWSIYCTCYAAASGCSPYALMTCFAWVFDVCDVIVQRLTLFSTWGCHEFCVFTSVLVFWTDSVSCASAWRQWCVGLRVLQWYFRVCDLGMCKFSLPATCRFVSVCV